MEGMSERNSGARLRVWERASEWPLTAIALAFLAVYAWEVIADLHGAGPRGRRGACNHRRSRYRELREPDV